MNKIFAIYKPIGFTSNDVVKIVKRTYKEKKVGHAGTLDPLAEGVLVIGVGREATKKLKEVVNTEKEYVALIKFGQTSTTDDEEGEKTLVNVANIPTLKKVESVVKKFQGEISQLPPVYSAIKVKGVEAYKLARQGKKVELKPRIVKIKKIEILKYNWPLLKIKAVTGPGTYIRALARDIGEKLKIGGYLLSLERVRVGQYSKEKAYSLENLKSNNFNFNN